MKRIRRPFSISDVKYMTLYEGKSFRAKGDNLKILYHMGKTSSERGRLNCTVHVSWTYSHGDGDKGNTYGYSTEQIVKNIEDERWIIEEEDKGIHLIKLPSDGRVRV